MSSQAYQVWASGRQQRIQELLNAHAQIGGTGRGRKWRTQQVNWALTTRLAAEFQGFARDLHDEAVDHLVDQISTSNIGLASVLRTRFTENRKLETGNATPGKIGEDFLMIGIRLWDLLRANHPQDASRWNRDLETLIRARNAIGHAQEAKLARITQDGYPMHLATIKRWRSRLDKLSIAMDDVVSDYLDGLLGTGRPW